MTEQVLLKRVALIRYGLGQPPPTSDSGIPIIRATNIFRGKIKKENLLRAQLRDLPLGRAPLLRAGEILVVRSGAYTGDSALVTEDWEGSAPGYDLRVSPLGVDSRFAAYNLLSNHALEQMHLSSSRAAQPHLNAEELGEVAVWLPSRERQRRIADFLDAETARVDKLTASRQKQISTLEERELAAIANMLSGGATRDNGHPTGWPWLPYIPSGWSIGPVHAYFYTDLGKMLNSERSAGGRQRPYLRNANIHWHEIDISDIATMSFAADERRRYSVHSGDLLICEGGAGVAEAAVWDGRIEECYFQKSLHRVRQAGQVPVEWLMYWLRLAKHCGRFEADGNIATIPHLTGEQLRQYRIPIPCDGESLARKTERTIKAIAKVRAALNRDQVLLAERRQALITAAVTGQFDVSTASGRGVTE